MPSLHAGRRRRFIIGTDLPDLNDRALWIPVGTTRLIVAYTSADGRLQGAIWGGT